MEMETLIRLQTNLIDEGVTMNFQAKLKGKAYVQKAFDISCSTDTKRECATAIPYACWNEV